MENKVNNQVKFPLSIDRKNIQIYFSIPSEKKLQEIISESKRNNKDFYATKVSRVRAFIARDNVDVKWVGDEKFIREANDIVKTVIAKGSTASKDILVKFYAYVFGKLSNIGKIAPYTFSAKSFDLARKIVMQGAFDFEDISTFMGWGKYERPRWGNRIDQTILRKWTNDPETSILALLTYFLHGPSGVQTSKWYVSSDPYLIPTSPLIELVLTYSGDTIRSVDDPIAIDASSRLFNGSDFCGKEGVLQKLIATERIPISKTKIPVNSIKKLNQYIPVAPLPYEEIMSRCEYIATMGVMVYGQPPSLEIPDKLEDDDKYIKDMADQLRMQRKYFLTTILARKVSNIPGEFFFYNALDLNNLYYALTFELYEKSFYYDKSWIEYNSLCLVVNRRFACTGSSYIYPNDNRMMLNNIVDMDRKPLSPVEYKKLFHDTLLRAMFEGLASIGGVDLCYNAEGEIIYVRHTEFGKWLAGFIKERPRISLTTSGENVFSIDDDTRFVIVKDPDNPLVPMLAEFADRISPTRYHINEKSMLRGCSNISDFETKMEQFKSFICNEPGEGLEALFRSIRKKSNLIRRTPGGSTYQLFDIDPLDIQLQKFILNDKVIKENCLKVEGCRLLVKTKFVSTFLERLRMGGYLNDEMI